MLRVVVVVNLLAALSVLIGVESPGDVPRALVGAAGMLELPLFIVVLLLYLLQPALAKRAAPPVWTVVGGLAVGVAGLVAVALDGPGALPFWRRVGWAALAALAVMAYFDYRGRRYSPALTEARLHALTARIRPHFLFNSLNGVLGVMREDPKRAELALEELADMFRVLMKEHKELVALDDEIALCKRYLDLERLRLGERIQVHWDLEFAPVQALVPPLLLQPLLENAVYHGIEPSLQPGDISVRVARRSGEVIIEVSNPIVDTPRNQRGNRMAQANIRERLALFFDLEADMSIDRRGGRYRVRIRLPYRRVKS
ncbi:MAG: histidine kinase [Rhodocyclaceae bacterium]|nr:histidine kinase [Rhodocyclaceae bacterium]